MAIYKVHQKGSKNNSFSEVERYYFDVENCKHCPFKEGCYKEGAKTKSLNITIKKEIHSQQAQVSSGLLPYSRYVSALGCHMGVDHRF